MITLLSRTAPTGHVVLVRLPDGASFAATYSDDHTTRDITAGVADLLLSGALDVLEQAASGPRPEPAETVDVAQVSYAEPLPAPGAVRAPASFSLLDVRTGQACDIDPDQVMALLVRGMGVEVTAAVAAEVAETELPDTPAGADPGTSDSATGIDSAEDGPSPDAA